VYTSSRPWDAMAAAVPVFAVKRSVDHSRAHGNHVRLVRASGPAVGLVAGVAGGAITASDHQVGSVSAYALREIPVVSRHTPRRPVYSSTTVVLER
jgi:hypothetical protein